MTRVVVVAVLGGGNCVIACAIPASRAVRIDAASAGHCAGD